MEKLAIDSSDMQIATCIAYAREASEHMPERYANSAIAMLADLMAPPIQAQRSAMESALEQACNLIDLKSLNISFANAEPTDVRLATAASNPEHTPDKHNR